MRKHLPPILTLLLGGAGFALRKWQLAEGFEADTGLAVTGAPSATALLALSLVTAGALLALLWTFRHSYPPEAAFSAANGNRIFLTAVVLSGFLLAVSAGFEIFGFSGLTAAVEGNKVTRIASRLLPPLRIFFCAMGLPASVLWCRCLYRAEDAFEKLSVLVLCLLYCMWLITTYQTRAADPVIQDYLYEVLSIVCSLLGLYYIAGYSFQTGSPRKTVFFCLMGVFFSLVTLADRHTYAEMARLGFAVLFLTAHAAVLLNQPTVIAIVTEDDTDAPRGDEAEAE